MKIDSTIRVDTEELSKKDWVKLLDQLTFVDKDEQEWCAYTHFVGAGYVRMARGALDLIPKGLDIVDGRVRPKLPKLPYVKELDANGFTGQKAAVKAMFENAQGQVRIPTGGGKTSIGCAFMAASCTRSLVLVHTKDLLDQWVSRAEEEIPGVDVGVIQGANNKIGHITVATMQTVRERYLKDERFWRRFGCLIVDESAHAANDSYTWILNSCPAYYRFGLSASEKRSDGMEKLIRYNIGPVIYKMPFRSQVPIEVQPVKSNFRPSYGASQYTQLVRQLVNDEGRNAMIARIVEREVEQGHTVLVLSRQIAHMELIADKMTLAMDGRVALVHGRSRLRREMIEQLRTGELRCVIGSQIFEEGVDVPRLDRVVLAFPGTDVTTLQKVGRATRRHEGKEMSVVIDVVDHHSPVLGRQYMSRKSWYREAKIPVRKMIDGRRTDGNQVERGRLSISSLSPRRSRRASAA